MQKMGPSFYDVSLQKYFRKNGYVIMDFLDSCQVDRLLNVYETFRQQHEAITIPFISTSHSNNRDLIASVDNAILKIVEPVIKNHIPDAQILFSNFLVKRNGQDSATSPHQDVTFVDENKFMSYSIWIPLSDVDITNGCMRVLSGSHNFPVNIRTHSPKTWKYNKIIKYIENDMVSCPMKKGQALIFPHSLIHGSFPNRGPENRIAVVIACYPQGAQLFHYQELPSKEKYGKYQMSKMAYVSYIKGAPPALGKYMGDICVNNIEYNYFTYHLLKHITRFKTWFT